MKKTGINTRLIHSDYPKKDPHGSLQVPLYVTSAFEFDTSEDLEGAFRGTKPAHAYSRSGNPTVEIFESRLRSIANAQGVVAFASGMAAISAVIMATCKAGDNVITTKKLFGNSYALFETTFKSFGINFKYADFTNLQTVAPLIDNNSRLIFLETINNPQLEVADIDAISEIAKQHKLIFSADTTLTPPNIFDAGAHGINIAVMSSTKYISSGAATIGGIVIDYGGFNWKENPSLSLWYEKFGPLALFAKLKKEILRNTGACLSPFNSYLQLLGLETMSLRFDRMTENAQTIGHWLSKHPKVKSVNYPGLGSSKYYTLGQQYYKKLGGLMTFNLGSQKECFELMDRLELVKRATNLNDNKSLIIHPASTIFSEYPPEILSEMDISSTMVRLSIGLEDADDIIADLEQALEAI